MSATEVTPAEYLTKRKEELASEVEQYTNMAGALATEAESLVNQARQAAAKSKQAKTQAAEKQKELDEVEGLLKCEPTAKSKRK